MCIKYTYFDEFLDQIPVHAVPGSCDVTIPIPSRLARGRWEGVRERRRERQGNTCSWERGMGMFRNVRNNNIHVLVSITNLNMYMHTCICTHTKSCCIKVTWF